MPNASHPLANADSAPYWQAAAKGRLVVQRCTVCGHAQFPPRHLCAACWSDALDWQDTAGHGTLHSFTIVRRAATASFAGRIPYVIAVVDLDEGPRVLANLIGPDARNCAIGDRLAVTFETIDGAVLPQFRRVPAEMPAAGG